MALLLATFPALTLTAAEIYKTVDANGNVTYSDHADPSSKQTTVVELQDPRYPPHEMHVCWTNCFTLTYDGHAYRRADGTDETWTVEKFNADSFVLHRHSAPAKWNAYSTDVTYVGHTANDRLVGVSVNGVPTSGIDASWGTALNTLPGSNAERDAMLKADSADAEQEPTASVAVAPPPVIDEPQPAAEQDGSLWTPGYWQWGGSNYAWISGAWAQPPAVGLLWTPAYWSFANGRYFFHPGHWGRHVGFYGGIDYGYGYFGNGYVGGHWVGKNFAYNSTVNHLKPGAIGTIYAEAVANRSAPARAGATTPPGDLKAVVQERTHVAPDALVQSAENPSARSAAPRYNPLPTPKPSHPTATRSPTQP